MRQEQEMTGSFEIERKFLIHYPDIRKLESLPNCRKVRIVQTYLKPENGEKLRVRQWEENGSRLYFKTLKRDVTDITRIEIEERLSEEEYLRLLKDADPAMQPIQKTRYCLTVQDQCFEIDVYPLWKDRAIAEIELPDEDAAIRFPEEIRVIREVTADARYRNSSLARTGGKQPED